MHDLGHPEERRQRRSDDAVHPVGAERAAGDVDEWKRGIEPVALEGTGPPAREELRPNRVAGDDDLVPRERPGRGGEGHGDPVGEPADEPVREPRDHDLLVGQEWQPPRRGRDGGRDRDEPAGRDDDGRAEAPEQRVRAAEACRHPERQVGHVAPGELAAKLAGRDRVVRDAGGGHPARLDARLAADPGEADVAAQPGREGLREGEARRGVPASPAAGEDDAERAPLGALAPRASRLHADRPPAARDSRAAASPRGARGPARSGDRPASDMADPTPPRGEDRPRGA